MSGLIPRLYRLLLFFSLTSSASTQDGKLAQFLTNLCGEPSVINPIVTLPLNTCLVTQDAQGLAVQLFPGCTSGKKATLIVYKDTMCAAIDPRIWTDNSTCISYGPSSRSVPAVMFACDAHAGDQPQATITSTVAAATNLITSATPSSFTAPTSSQVSSSGASGNSNSNLPRAGQIALGVVLPLGAIGVALLAWLCPKPWNKRKEEGKSGEQHKSHEMYM